MRADAQLDQAEDLGDFDDAELSEGREGIDGRGASMQPTPIHGVTDCTECEDFCVGEARVGTFKTSEHPRQMTQNVLKTRDRAPKRGICKALNSYRTTIAFSHFFNRTNVFDMRWFGMEWTFDPVIVIIRGIGELFDATIRSSE
jgi:hypothetical protein